MTKSRPGRITDTQMLDWLGKREWEFFGHQCYQLNKDGLSFARYRVRQCIRDAMRAERK